MDPTNDSPDTSTAEAVAAKPHRKHPFAPFHNEILTKIIAPKLQECVERRVFENRADLHRYFNSTWDTTISYGTFAEWCDDLGIIFHKVVNVEIPGFRKNPALRLTPTNDQAMVGGPGAAQSVRAAPGGGPRVVVDDGSVVEFDAPPGAGPPPAANVDAVNALATGTNPDGTPVMDDSGLANVGLKGAPEPAISNDNTFAN